MPNRHPPRDSSITRMNGKAERCFSGNENERKARRNCRFHITRPRVNPPGGRRAVPYEAALCYNSFQPARPDQRPGRGHDDSTRGPNSPHGQPDVPEVACRQV